MVVGTLISAVIGLCHALLLGAPAQSSPDLAGAASGIILFGGQLSGIVVPTLFGHVVDVVLPTRLLVAGPGPVLAIAAVLCLPQTSHRFLARLRAVVGDMHTKEDDSDASTAPHPPDTGLAAGLAAHLPHWEEVYRELHAHPELAFRGTPHRGHRPARAVPPRRLGRDRAGRGQWAWWPVLRNGDGPVSWLRADMDALPVHEATGLPYASTEAGVMHACGHDVHVAALLGACRQLAAHPEAWQGTVVAVFQPAEEVAARAGDAGRRCPRPVPPAPRWSSASTWTAARGPRDHQASGPSAAPTASASPCTERAPTPPHPISPLIRW